MRRKGTKVVSATEGIRLVRLLRQLIDTLADAKDRTREALQDVDDRLDPIEKRLLLVDELPASAPMGALIRLTTGPAAGRVPLYLGNGPGQPLSKLVPEPV